jgi:hypothetical protein
MAPVLPEFWAASNATPVSWTRSSRDRLAMFHAPFTSASVVSPQFWHENLPATRCPRLPPMNSLIASGSDERRSLATSVGFLSVGFSVGFLSVGFLSGARMFNEGARRLVRLLPAFAQEES